MARKAYPSDHRRWFRLAEDILDDRRLAGLGNDGLAAWTRLLALLNRRKSRDGKIALDPIALQAMCGKRRRDVALTLARRLADVGLTSMRLDGDVTEIIVSKWPEWQGFAPTKLRRDSGETPAPTPTPTPTPIKEEKRRPASPPAPPRIPRIVCPEATDFAERFRDSLAAVHPGIKPPTPAAFRKWVASADLMFRVDRRDPEEVARVAAWLFASDHRDAAFWRRNVLAVPKFRERYDQLAAQMRAAERGESNGSTISGQHNRLRAWAMQD